MQVLYFSWIRETIGTSGEEMPKPESVNTVADLLDHLCNLGDQYGTALKERVFVKVAVNQVHVDHDHPLGDTDEVALFPPVTGG